MQRVSAVDTLHQSAVRALCKDAVQIKAEAAAAAANSTAAAAATAEVAELRKTLRSVRESLSTTKLQVR